MTRNQKKQRRETVSRLMGAAILGVATIHLVVAAR